VCVCVHMHMHVYRRNVISFIHLLVSWIKIGSESLT